ncbi:MAG: protein phosphatase 2C domain-containing protein [Gemmatimonadaceae bacterium]|nr:protein phosphatase 2C domain-containing protein [Gemmatimonadaceae bacterium]
MTDSRANGPVIVHVFGRTDVGRTREHNEDAFVVADLTTMNATLQPEVRTHVTGERGTLFMVADGMGGAAAGEVASQMATEIVLAELDARWRQSPMKDADTFAAAIRGATEMANVAIHRFAAEHPENRGMGTTATIAGLLGDRLYLAQVGDSRSYLVRNGHAIQITKDQSLMQKLIEAGELTPEEAEVSERRNIILQALGPEPAVKVDLTHQPVRAGDTLILCSDGMSGQMRANDIARIVDEGPDLVTICKALIELANENGGPDNITVIAARFEGEGLQPPEGADAVGHAVFRSSGESRATMPVDANLVATLEVAASAPTRPSKPPTPRVTAPVAPPASAAPPSSGRPSPTALRLIFGAIFILVAAALYLTRGR